MAIKKLVLCCLGTIFIASCASYVPRNIEKVPDFYQQNQLQNQTTQNFLGTLSGKVKHTDKNGFSYSCYNHSYSSNVYLIPYNDYFKKLIQADSRGNFSIPGINTLSLNDIKTSTCNNKGQFFFDNLPSSKWFLVTYIPEEHIWMKRIVSSRNGEQDDVYLMNSDEVYKSRIPKLIKILSYKVKSQNDTYKPLPWGTKGVK